MKAVEKLFIPARTIRLRKTPTQTRESFSPMGKNILEFTKH